MVRLPVPVANLARRLAAGGFQGGDIAAFLDVEPRTALTVPLVASVAACGFPSPADDYLDRPLDFNELLIENPAATFAVRVSGESMTGAGIFPGDIAIVDRSISAAHGKVVIALVGNEFTLKRYCIKGGVTILRAENPAFSDLVVDPEISFEIWGVVTGIARRF